MDKVAIHIEVWDNDSENSPEPIWTYSASSIRLDGASDMLKELVRMHPGKLIDLKVFVPNR